MANGPIVVVVHLWAKEGTEAQVADALKTMTDLIIEEPTCRFVKAVRSVEDPLHYMLYEEWNDRDAYATVQLERAYRRDFSERMAELAIRESHTEIFELSYQPWAQSPRQRQARDCVTWF